MAVVRVGWQIMRPGVLGNGMRPITLTPEVMAAAILAENNKISYEEAERFVNGLTQAQIAELNKQGIDVANSSYSPEYKATLVDLYNQTQNETTIAIDPNDRPKLEGTQIPEQSKPVVIGTPIQEQDKEAGKLADPIPEQDKNAGIYAGPEIEIGDWRDFILTNQDKSFVDYKGDLNKGDQIDLSKFTDRQKVSGGKANYVDPKTGWILSPDRAGANSHGGSAWKLTDKKGNRIATLDENGNVLRK